MILRIQIQTKKELRVEKMLSGLRCFHQACSLGPFPRAHTEVEGEANCTELSLHLGMHTLT